MALLEPPQLTRRLLSKGGADGSEEAPGPVCRPGHHAWLPLSPVLPPYSTHVLCEDDDAPYMLDAPVPTCPDGPYEHDDWDCWDPWRSQCFGNLCEDDSVYAAHEAARWALWPIGPAPGPGPGTAGNPAGQPRDTAVERGTPHFPQQEPPPEPKPHAWASGTSEAAAPAAEPAACGSGCGSSSADPGAASAERRGEAELLVEPCSAGARVCWRVPASKLKGKATQVASPRFQVAVVQEAPQQHFQLYARPAGGDNFTKSSGRGSVLVKCQSELPPEFPKLSVAIGVGVGAGAEESEREHDFATTAWHNSATMNLVQAAKGGVLTISVKLGAPEGK